MYFHKMDIDCFLDCFLVDSITVYEETVRRCVCMVFFFRLLFLLRQMLVSRMYIIIIEKTTTQ